MTPPPKKTKVFIDGASRGNPGRAAVGVVFQTPSGKTTKTLSCAIGTTTNNVAEYAALLYAMQEALIMGVGELEVCTDSELVAKQFRGEYRIKEPFLRVLYDLALHLKKGFKSVTICHVPREQNTLADKEANKALDGLELF